MWGNLTNNFNSVVEAAKKSIDELEQQLDAAVEQDTEGLTAEDLPDMDGLLVRQPHMSIERAENDGDMAISSSLNKSTPEEGIEKAKETEVISEKSLHAQHDSNAPEPAAGTTTADEAKNIEDGGGIDKNMQVGKVKEAHELALKEVKMECKKRLSSLQSDLTEAKLEIERYKQKLLETEKDHKASLEEEKNELTAKMTRKHEVELQKVSAAHSQTKSELEALSSSQKKRCQALEEDNACLRDRYEVLQKELAILRQDHAEQTANLEALKATSQAATRQGLEGQTGEVDKSQDDGEQQVIEDSLEKEALKACTAKCKQLQQRITEAAEEAERQRTSHEEQLSGLRESLDAAHQKMDKHAEVLAERERALLSLQERLLESERQVEESTTALDEAKQRLTEHGEKTQTPSVAALEAKLSTLHAEAADKDERLASFEREGQVLAKKHADMLQSVRKGKAEIKDKEKALSAANSTKQALEQQLAELKAKLATAEKDASTATRSLSAVQVANQTSGDKLARLELELAAKTEELSTQKRALDEAWEALKEAKREVAEHKAQVSALERQLGEENTRLKATEEDQKSVVSRESALRANAAQLQDSLQRHMQESSARETRLRDELKDIRSRWQEVVAAREAMVGELNNASAPLLQQINKLQDTLRTKTETWAALESGLSERALRAESGLEVALSKRDLAEDQLRDARVALDSATSRSEELESQKRALQTELDAEKASLAKARERVEHLEADVSACRESEMSLQSVCASAESRIVTLEAALSSKEDQIARLEDSLDAAYEEKEELLARVGTGPSSHSRLATPFDKATEGSRTPASALRSSDSLTDAITGDSAEPSMLSMTSGSAKSLRALRGPDVLPSGELSYAASLRMEQTIRRREEEVEELSGRVRSLESAREALLKEVTFLSSRNAELEDTQSLLPDAEKELKSAHRRADLLLLMVGEKDEEIEGLLSDLQDTKQMYREQMDTLLEQIATHSAGDANPLPLPLPLTQDQSSRVEG